jgi:peptide/nickel transport system permease protein
MSVGTPILETVVRPSRVRSRSRRFSGRIGSVLAAGWLLTVLVLALLAPFIGLPDSAVSTGDYNAPLFGKYLLGTDGLGRDHFSRLVWGARASLFIGGVTISITLVVGTMLGLIAGYFRGKADLVISGMTDFILAMPGMVFLLVLTAIFRPTPKTLIVGISVLLVPTFVRLSRAQTISWTEREFVRAAHVLGARHRRVILYEVLPNIVPAMLTFALAIGGQVLVLEGSLSFLGLGIPPPTPSWGSMIATGQLHMARHPQVVLLPAVCLFLTVLSTNVLGNRREISQRTKGPVL